ncbi:hypothetical protein [Georgenia satyanarayanai]|nr:hypothetical protein [Georgenia satyanarayanai]
MDADITAAAIAAAGAVVAATVTTLLRSLFRRNIRDDIERELRIVAALRADSKARVTLMDKIERRVELLAAREEASRSWFGAGLAAVFLASFGWLTYLTASAGGWWWIVAVPAGFITLVMLPLGIRDLRKVPRDEQGRPLSDRQ